MDHKTVSKLRKAIWGSSPDTELNKERKVQRGDSIYTINTANIGKPPPLKEKPEKTTTVEQELKEQGKHLGLHYDQSKDQVLPDVERNHSSPDDVVDRPGADIAMVKMDAEMKKRYFVTNRLATQQKF